VSSYYLDDLRGAVKHADVSAPLSQWSVGMHVHHCCLAMISIGKGLAKSALPSPPSKPSPRKLIALKFGFIPRGRAKNPSRTDPQVLPADQLFGLIDEAERQLAASATVDPGQWISHPIFGTLRRDAALRFVEVHNRHHLKIVRDILKLKP
jgi:hypothetical protein